MSGNVIFNNIQQKSLVTNRHEHYFLNSWYYGNKLVTIHTYYTLTNVCIDGHAYRRLNENTVEKEKNNKR